MKNTSRRDFIKTILRLSTVTAASLVPGAYCAMAAGDEQNIQSSSRNFGLASISPDISDGMSSESSQTSVQRQIYALDEPSRLEAILWQQQKKFPSKNYDHVKELQDAFLLTNFPDVQRSYEISFNKKGDTVADAIQRATSILNPFVVNYLAKQFEQKTGRSRPGDLLGKDILMRLDVPQNYAADRFLVEIVASRDDQRLRFLQAIGPERILMYTTRTTMGGDTEMVKGRKKYFKGLDDGTYWIKSFTFDPTYFNPAWSKKTGPEPGPNNAYQGYMAIIHKTPDPIPAEQFAFVDDTGIRIHGTPGGLYRSHGCNRMDTRVAKILFSFFLDKVPNQGPVLNGRGKNYAIDQDHQIRYFAVPRFEDYRIQMIEEACAKAAEPLTDIFRR